MNQILNLLGYKIQSDGSAQYYISNESILVWVTDEEYLPEEITRHP